MTHVNQSSAESSEGSASLGCAGASHDVIWVVHSGWVGSHRASWVSRSNAIMSADAKRPAAVVTPLNNFLGPEGDTVTVP
jgi:hypothetical protein